MFFRHRNVLFACSVYDHCPEINGHPKNFRSPEQFEWFVAYALKKKTLCNNRALLLKAQTTKHISIEKFARTKTIFVGIKRIALGL